jgi:hypothetical protein
VAVLDRVLPRLVGRHDDARDLLGRGAHLAHARYDRFDGIRRSELVKPGDPDPNGLGAVRWVWIGPLRFEEEITAFAPPSRLDYLIRDVKTLPFRHEGGNIPLRPDGTGSRACGTSSFKIPIPLIGGALDRIFSLRLERGFGHVLERSAELSTHTSPASS